MTVEIDSERTFSIRDVASRTGLSVDTLRWYEREGIVPPVDRNSQGQRRYSSQQLAFIELVVALRRTGMPVSQIKEFVSLSRLGAETHADRLAILERQRASILQQRRQLEADLDAVQDKVAHYRYLISEGLDCDGLPVGRGQV